MTADELKLFELYLSTAEKISDRRAQANAWLLSIASALTALQNLMKPDSGLSAGRALALTWTIPSAGIVVAIAWMALLLSYRQLNSAKFKVLQEMESDFTHRPFARERDIYKAERRISFSDVEALVPVAFFFFFAIELFVR